MNTSIVVILISGLISLVAGYLLAIFYQKILLKDKNKRIIEEANKEAEMIKKNKILEAKEQFMQMKAEHEKKVNEFNIKVANTENKTRQKEQTINQKSEEFSKKIKEVDNLKNNLNSQLTAVEKKKEQVEKSAMQQAEQLEKIAGMSVEEAKKQLIESLTDQARTTAAIQINEIVEEAKMTANKEAKKIVIQTIQRVGTEVAIENAITVFNIENDEMKGRIIGREGRNIRALEAATGVEFIIDDTPEAIVLSCFDPVRREIARLSLQNLIADGRIHPGRIEEVVAKMTKQIEEEIIEVGKRTVIDLGIHNMHNELIRIVGKMKYRSSYGQNLLQHSRETAKLCALMANDFGLNNQLAKRAGLLHDIGKVPNEEPDLSHALYGMRIAEKYKEKPEVCNAIGSHHEEVEMDNLLSPIVQLCDGISGARPGARREILDSYIKRITELEDIALSYPGVTKTYAIQAGREVRVIVSSEKVTDQAAQMLSSDIARKVQNEMTYPGQIKITVIRETRAVDYAK